MCSLSKYRNHTLHHTYCFLSSSANNGTSLPTYLLPSQSAVYSISVNSLMVPFPRNVSIFWMKVDLSVSKRKSQYMEQKLARTLSGFVNGNKMLIFIFKRDSIYMYCNITHKKQETKKEQNVLDHDQFFYLPSVFYYFSGEL